MTLVTLIFVIVKFKKITGYYLESNVRRKLLIRNIVPFLASMIFYIVVKVMFYRGAYDISIICLILSMWPSIETTRDIGVKVY